MYKGTKKFVAKRKLQFENYKSYLKATQLENNINYLGKNEIAVDSLKKDYKEFMKTIN